MSDDDFFAELEAEIAIHTKKTQMRKDAEAAKKKANNRTLDERERQEALSYWRECQAILDADIWRPTSAVAFFTEQCCDGCGSIHRVFLQYMEQQAHRANSANRRWIRVSQPQSYLPKQILVQVHQTHICADCASEHGFTFEEASSFPLTRPAGISSTYFQGDINAAPEESGSAASDGITTSGESLH